MKLFVNDSGFGGASIVCAENIEKAHEYYKEANPVHYTKPTFQEYEIKDGLIVETLGDL